MVMPLDSTIDAAKKGSADLLILALIDDEPLHGYDIAGRIEARSDGTLRFTLASLYATLYRLEERESDPRPLGRASRSAPPPLLPHYQQGADGARVAARRLEPLHCRRHAGRRAATGVGPAEAGHYGARSTAMASNIDWRRDIAARAKAAGLDAARRDDRRDGRAPRRDLRGRHPRRRQRRRGAERRARAALDESRFDVLLARPAPAARLRRRHPSWPRQRPPESQLRGVPFASPCVSSGCVPASRHHDPRARARHRREHDRLHGRGFRAAAAAAVRRSRSARHACGTRTRAVDCSRSRCRRSRSWTTARFPSSRARRHGGGPASTSSIPVSIRFASTRSKSAATCSTCSVCARSSGDGFPVGGPFFVGNEPIVVISDRLWRTRYHADRSIVGRQLRFNGQPLHRRRRHASALPLPRRCRCVAAAGSGT